MAENSKIEWTDHTFNPWRGCLKIAPGCKFCYAEKLVNGRMQGDFSHKRVRLSDAGWKEPLKWNKKAECNYHRRADLGEKHLSACPQFERPRVFCASLADVFEDWQRPIVDHHGRVLWTDGVTRTSCKPENRMEPPFRTVTLDNLRRDLFALIDATPNLDWLLLTKRPENIRRMWPTHERWVNDYRPNVWLGTSISDQATADANLPELLKCRDLAPVLFASYEPALGEVNLRRFFAHSMHCKSYRGGEEGFSGPECDCGAPRLKWVIVGGESGHNARPFDIAWARSTIEQCMAAGVPCFVKQLGAVCVDSAFSEPDGTPGFIGGIKDRKGGGWQEWPEALRVRQFPEAAK